MIMYSLLIVDDEPIIADTLGFLINSLTELKLDVFTTYNAYEALELMNKRKIDIVLSDIRMPGMDGITLQKEIYKHWKNCKIIFLTGYNDFSYIQTIIRNGGSVDYILKSEDDEEIIQAVQKAIVKIEEERQKEKILLRSQEKIRVALPIMQKEYFVELIHNQDLVVTKEKLLELEIPLDSTQKLMMVLGKINLTSKNQQETEKYLNKLQKLLINTFDHSIQFVSILYDKRRIILIVQPKLANDWTRSLETVSTIMKSANNYMNHTYNISTSFSYSTKPFSWQDIGDLFYRLNTLIVREVGIGKGVIVQDVDLIDYAEPLQSNVNHLLQLEGYLEMGDRQSFYELLFSLYHQAKKNGSHLLYEYLTALTNIILQYLNKYNLYSTLQIDIDDVIYNTQFIHRSI